MTMLKDQCLAIALPPLLLKQGYLQVHDNRVVTMDPAHLR